MASSPKTSPSIVSQRHTEHDAILSDTEEEDEFVTKYGEINFQYIRKPKDSFWFVRPHALNFFKDGVLYRTKGERTSGKTELFLDLLYVGIVANLAEHATENASGASFLQYVLLFIPTWTVWSDIKDFVNYYYSEDFSQKLYILWIMVLLLVYDNNCSSVLDGRKGAAMTIVPYMLCRVSLALSLFFYSIWVSEHRFQMRVYGVTVICTSLLWIIVIFVNSVRAKIGVAFAIIALEYFCFIFCYHPWVKKNVFKLTVSTALNLEHEVERFGAFFIIAVGEFLYKTVAGNPIGYGFTLKLARGICCLIIAYVILWIYFNGGTSERAVHALRRNGWSACIYIYAHLPLIAGLILAADSAGEWITLDFTSTAKHLKELEHIVERAAESEEELPSMYALSFFFTGGICVALLSLFIMAFAEKSKDPKNHHVVTKFWRVLPRLPAGIIILCMSFAEMHTTKLMGLVTMIMAILWLWESIVSTPRVSLPKQLGGCTEQPLSEEIESF